MIITTTTTAAAAVVVVVNIYINKIGTKCYGPIVSLPPAIFMWQNR